MSEFSEYFKKCVNQCGKKRYQLAIESGVKEAMISRMKASDKDVSRLCKKPELMERLIRVMDLPEEQSIRLWKLYLQELKRCPGYEYLVANIQLLDQFRMMKQTENLPLSEGMDLQDQQILSGKRRIFEVCQELVLREAAREHGQIQMQVRTDWEEFNYILGQAMQQNGSLRIDHLVAMEQIEVLMDGTPEKQSASRNAHIFMNLIPLLMHQQKAQYQIHMFYTKTQYYYSDFQIYCFYLITSEGMVLFDKEYSYGMLVTNPQTLAEKRLWFQDKQTVTRNMCKVEDNIPVVNSNLKFVYAFGTQPCFGVARSEALFQKYVIDWNNPLMKNFLQYNTEEYKNLMGRPVHSYFTREGIRHFLETGRLEEIPSVLYRPLEVEDCKDMIRILLQKMEEGLYKGYLMQESLAQIYPEGLVINAYRDDALILYFYRDGLRKYITVQDRELSKCLLTVLLGTYEGQEQHDTLEETKQYLRTMLRQNYHRKEL